MLSLPPTMYSHTPRDSGITLTETPEKMDSDNHRVSLGASDDPLCFSHLKKWTAVAMICTGGFCVACASSMAAFAEEGMAAEFHVSHEATILSISLFVLGLGAGPLITGPFSEVYGRAIIYRISYVFSVLFCLPVVLAPNLGVALAFRFLLGACGASFLSVAGGSVADMFAGSKVGTPMAVYTISPFLGPALGPVIGGFINQNLYWRWTYRIIIIWTFVQLVGIFLFVPESYAPVLLQRKARKLREDTGDQAYWAPLDHRDTSLGRSLLLSCYVPFKLLIFDRMALLLDTWNALLLGILYLMFQAFPIIFEDEHHFNVQSTGLAFLGIALGMVIGLATQPFWNRLLSREAANHGGKAPPEALLIMAEAGGVMVPLSLYWFAFSTYPQVHWIVPILASIPFGTGIFFVFTATFTYVVTAYRPIAASAMASNSVMRLASAAAFPLFAGAMYNKLGTVGATALLAGLTTIMAPLPFIFYRIGARLRAQSSFTH
ncbi:major facilitator superfamily domain-containing protein [Mycena maculata]|uniref:Major facilitator superfamily domain-containing protein n=1 Tax=Mycena maculata TaxID=230809 RepID=A0AAD7NLR0_9AGAR|nr:major facilitator superfamily domain-containing protein [Mycena maculata]